MKVTKRESLGFEKGKGSGGKKVKVQYKIGAIIGLHQIVKSTH